MNPDQLLCDKDISQGLQRPKMACAPTYCRRPTYIDELKTDLNTI